VLYALAAGQLDRVVTPERTYTGDGNDRFMGNFELGMATKFIDDLRANVRRGNRARFEQGWPNYRPPLGYLNNPPTKTVIKDPVRFPLVRRMWDLFLTGTMNPGRIRQIANEEWGLRTRRSKRTPDGPLSQHGVYSIFHNPFYKGLIQLRDGRTYLGAHEPMVTAEEFQRAQEILGRPAKPRPEKHAFPYTGLIICGHCGGQVTAEVHVKPSGRAYTYYHCTHQKTGRPCRERAISAAQLEGQLASMLGRLSMPPPVLEWLLKKAHQQMAGEEVRREQVLAAQRAALDSTRRQEQTLLDLRLRDLITDEVFRQRRNALEKNRLDLERRLQTATNPAAHDLAAKVDEIIRFGETARATFTSGTQVQRRAILEAIASNYTLMSRKVACQLEKPFELLIEANGISHWQTIVDDLRTWLLEKYEGFWLPKLDGAASDHTMTRESAIV